MKRKTSEVGPTTYVLQTTPNDNPTRWGPYVTRFHTSDVGPTGARFVITNPVTRGGPPAIGFNVDSSTDEQKT